MQDFKYFRDVHQAAFTEEPCQYCNSTQNCLEGVYFERLDVKSICLECFSKKRVCVEIPPYIRNRIKDNGIRKSNELSFTPPIPWVQHNDWAVCCDDYMEYIGEWEQDQFDDFSTEKDGIALLEELLDDKTRGRVDDITVLWDDLGYDTVAYVFKCRICGKMRVVCQSF